MNKSSPVLKLTSPTLLVSKSRCIRNIRKLSEKANNHNLVFRPHFKTHNDHTIGNWFRDFGVEKITVSSVEMAKYFYDDGWQDLLIAFPFNMLEMNTVNAFPSIVSLHLTVCSASVTARIAAAARRNFGICIKIDTGYGRTGLTGDQAEEIRAIIAIVQQAEYLSLTGFITHAGHTYHAAGTAEILEIHRQSCRILTDLGALLSPGNMPVLSVGDTPACSLAGDFHGIHEIRPGNFVFYDCMQLSLGSCSADEIAVVLACPVVAKNDARHEILIHGGAVHLSKDFIVDAEGHNVYGLVVMLNETGWSLPLAGARVSSLSQEHGIIRAGRDVYDTIHPGMMIGILPVHSCLTMAAMRKYMLVD